MPSQVVVGTGGQNGLPDHLEHPALIHIVQLEEVSRATEAETD